MKHEIYFLESGKFISKINDRCEICEIDGNNIAIDEEEISQETFDRLKTTALPVYNFFRAGGEEERKLYAE